MSFDHLDARLLKGLSDEHLQDRFDLKVVVEEIRVIVMNLDTHISTLFIWDVNGRGRQINIVVRLNLRLIDHIVTII